MVTMTVLNGKKREKAKEIWMAFVWKTLQEN